MNPIHSPVETSLLQAAQAQQQASRQRDRERAAAEQARRFADRVELRIAGVEEPGALRRLPENDSEQAESEHRAESHERRSNRVNDPAEDESPPHIDVTA